MYLVSIKLRMDTYFKRLKPCVSRTNFILDNGNTYFVNEVDPNRFKHIHSTCGIRLWCNKQLLKRCVIQPSITPDTVHKIPFPVLQSHLQKAVRLGLWESASDTLTSMLLISIPKTLRRIIVIMIEDVSLIQGSQFIVWLLMVSTYYKPTLEDIDAIYRLVNTLCTTTVTFIDIPNHSTTFKNTQLSHKYICCMSNKHAVTDTLLGLYYRIKYGGIVNDMQLLRRAIYIYGGEVGQHQNIQPMSSKSICIIKRQLDVKSIVFIPAAIDFHPFPWMVYRLSQHTKLPEHKVKQLIWNIESCINSRKLETMSTRISLMESDEWKTLREVLYKLRKRILKNITRADV